jgi:hypothetical protein
MAGEDENRRCGGAARLAALACRNKRRAVNVGRRTPVCAAPRQTRLAVRAHLLPHGAASRASNSPAADSVRSSDKKTKAAEKLSMGEDGKIASRRSTRHLYAAAARYHLETSLSIEGSSDGAIWLWT